MWSFEKYVRKETTIPESVIMTMRSGLEARYTDRFRSYAGTTEDALKSADNARKTADSLRTAAGVVDAQRENTDDLFAAAELMVKMIDDFQRESGVKQIRNIPLAGASIKESHGKKLGYTKLAMKFVSAGLLHFMEISLNMMEDLKNKDKIIQAIADHRVDIPVLGRLTEVDLDDLSSDDPIVETKIPLQQDDLEEELLKEAGKTKDTSTYSNETKPIAEVNAPMTPPKTPKPSEKKPQTPPKPTTPTSTKAIKK